MDLFSILKDAIAAGVSADKENEQRQLALLNKLVGTNAELKRCTYLVANERERLTRRVRAIPGVKEHQVAFAIEKIEETLSEQNEIIGLNSEIAKSVIENLQFHRINDFSKLEPSISQWSSSIPTIRDYVSGIVRKFDQIIDNALK